MGIIFFRTRLIENAELTRHETKLKLRVKSIILVTKQ